MIEINCCTKFQTETGGHVITPLPGCTPTKPGSACFPFFGVLPVILDESGKELVNISFHNSIAFLFLINVIL